MIRTRWKTWAILIVDCCDLVGLENGEAATFRTRKIAEMHKRSLAGFKQFGKLKVVQLEICIKERRAK